jgi:hypothetical protein
MSDIRKRLIGLCDVFNAHDVDRIMAFFAELRSRECRRAHNPGALALKGGTPRRRLASRFEGLPDVHYGDQARFVDADRTASGTVE